MASLIFFQLQRWIFPYESHGGNYELIQNHTEMIFMIVVLASCKFNVR